MVNCKLEQVMKQLSHWCQAHDVPVDVAVDEDDLQGALVLRRCATMTPRLRSFLAPLLAREGVHERTLDTRAGTVLLYSLVALTEDALTRFLDDPLPPYVTLVDQALSAKVLPTEARYVHPTKRATIGRSTWPNFSATEGRLPTRRQRLSAGGDAEPLAEALGGIAANYDPNEVKQALGGIMASLGLDAQLKNAGIKNKISDDGQYVVFYNVDQSGQPQPIIRYELSELGEEAKMYEALDFLADLAKREAPGTGKQTREKQKEQETAMRQLIKNKLPRRPEDQQGGDNPMQPVQAPPGDARQQPVGGARGGGFPAMPESLDKVSGDLTFRGRVAAVFTP